LSRRASRICSTRSSSRGNGWLRSGIRPHTQVLRAARLHAVDDALDERDHVAVTGRPALLFAAERAGGEKVVDDPTIPDSASGAAKRGQLSTGVRGSVKAFRQARWGMNDAGSVLVRTRHELA